MKYLFSHWIEYVLPAWLCICSHNAKVLITSIQICLFCRPSSYSSLPYVSSFCCCYICCIVIYFRIYFVLLKKLIAKLFFPSTINARRVDLLFPSMLQIYHTQPNQTSLLLYVQPLRVGGNLVCSDLFADCAWWISFHFTCNVLYKALSFH